MTHVSSCRARALAIAAGLAWLGFRPARGEESVRYKYQDYQESGGRVGVQVHAGAIEKDFGPSTHLKVEGVVDAIAGATPNGQPAPAGSTQVPLSRLTERRKAWNAALSHQFAAGTLALGVANSRESDYVSTGWSLNTSLDFNQKNTALLIGVASTEDDIKVFYQRDWARKYTHDVILGGSQLLDAHTALTLNLTWGRQRGYLSDPYKLVQKTTEIVPGASLPLTFPENRPAERDKGIALAGIHRAFPRARGALDLSYRLYHDTYDTTAHTLDAAWFQRVGERLVLRPGVRYYRQSAADFYYYRLDGTAVVPVAGRPQRAGPFYSSDYRLSAMDTWTCGIKAVWNATDMLQFDAAYERYTMQGRDGVTPASAYCRADIVTVGAKVSW